MRSARLICAEGFFRHTRSRRNAQLAVPAGFQLPVDDFFHSLDTP